MGKSPEEIACDAIRHGFRLGGRDFPGDPAQFARDIEAYGDQRAAQALAEQKSSPDKTPEPSKLEQVAKAICEVGRPAGQWEALGENAQWAHTEEARAAIKALRHPTLGQIQAATKDLPDRDIKRDLQYGQVFDAMLDSILSETEGK